MLTLLVLLMLAVCAVFALMLLPLILEAGLTLLPYALVILLFMYMCG